MAFFWKLNFQNFKLLKCVFATTKFLILNLYYIVEMQLIYIP